MVIVPFSTMTAWDLWDATGRWSLDLEPVHGFETPASSDTKCWSQLLLSRIMFVTNLEVPCLKMFYDTTLKF